MDYHCASLLLVSMLFVAVSRTCSLRRPVQVVVLGLLLLAAVTFHVLYMNFVHFDYGLNMKSSIAVVLLVDAFFGVWALWGLRLHRHRGLLLVFLVSLALAGLLEVYDFPPSPHYGRLFDAHSVWHGLTSPLGVLLYVFFCMDAREEAEAAASRRGRRSAAGSAPQLLYWKRYEIPIFLEGALGKQD
jgi:post-GPI attachment to proteins factor 3